MPKFLTIAAAVAALTSPVLAAGFAAELDPAPFDAATRSNVINSIGDATATLNGDTLTVSGSFRDLASSATGGSLRIGVAKGVPGDAVATLTVDHAQVGHFAGSLTLSPAQVAALNASAIYVRIDSEKAPDGNLQGWLENAGK